jgi:hypothetical protein
MQLASLYCVLLVLLACSYVLPFRMVGISRVRKSDSRAPVSRSSSGSKLAMVERGSGSGDDFDSSEMMAMSSSELKEYKMKQQVEAEKAEAARVSALLKSAGNLVTRVEEEKSTSSNGEVAAPALTTAQAAVSPVAFPDAGKQVAPASGASGQTDGRLANFSAGSSGFDLGLLIAFPVIIGTLALFFVFPLVGEKLAGGSGPLPPGSPGM